MRRHLRAAVAGEDAFEVHPGRAHRTLAGLKVGEVPHVHPRHERALGRDVEEAAQELEIVPAHVGPTSQTPFAPATSGLQVGYADTVADCPGGHCISDSDHISCHLMPKYAREMSRQLASCLLDIGVADAAGTDFHQYLRWKKFRHGNLLQLPSLTLRWYRRQHVRLYLVGHITDLSDGLAPHSSPLELL